MPRAKSEASRATGPTWIPSKERWRVSIFKVGKTAQESGRSDRWFSDEDEAKEYRETVEPTLNRFVDINIGQAIEGYIERLKESGTLPVSYKETKRRLGLFFKDHGSLVSRVSNESAKAMYEAFRKRSRPDGAPISVYYHQCALINARSFMGWCVEQGWLRSNPLTGVKGIGKKNKGKLQHTGNETRTFFVYCLAKAEAGDKAALGVLMALLMALRSSDITRRVVRDVDFDATVLRVTGGKTAKSNRPRKIPDVLQPLLRELSAGRDPFDPLFKTPYTKSGHHTRRWLEEAMVKLCKGAGVPYVCPHALKGTASTLLAETGEAADVIADHLSHEKLSTTTDHYIASGALEDAQTGKGVRMITDGGK